jgi:predicted ATPase
MPKAENEGCTYNVGVAGVVGFALLRRGISSRSLPRQVLDPSQRRQLTLNALQHSLLRESQLQPLLLIFEDFQWIDGLSESRLDPLRTVDTYTA